MAEGRGGWCVSRGFQPPRSGFHQVKASQAFTPSLSKEGSFVSFLCRRG